MLILKATELLSLSPSSQCARLPCSLASRTRLPSGISKSQLSMKNIVSPLHHYFCTHSLSSPTAPLPLLRSLPWNDCQFLLLPHQSDLNESPHSHNPSSMLLYASTWHSSTFTHQVAAKALVLVFTDILPSDLS